MRAILSLVALAVIAVGCGSGQATPPPTYPPGSIVVTAHNLAFDTAELMVPADTKFTLVLVNKDSDMHNIAIRTERGSEGDLVFRHDPISASTAVLQVGPIKPGTYFFICEQHPSMTGTVIAH